MIINITDGLLLAFSTKVEAFCASSIKYTSFILYADLLFNTMWLGNIQQKNKQLTAAIGFDKFSFSIVLRKELCTPMWAERAVGGSLKTNFTKQLWRVLCLGNKWILLYSGNDSFTHHFELVLCVLIYICIVQLMEWNMALMSWKKSTRKKVRLIWFDFIEVKS